MHPSEFHRAYISEKGCSLTRTIGNTNNAMLNTFSEGYVKLLSKILHFIILQQIE